MLVIVCREKGEVDGASNQWDLEQESEEKKIIVRTEMWVDHYNLSSIRKKNIDAFLFGIQSNLLQTVGPACDKFKSQLIATLDPRAHFLSFQKNIQKENIENAKKQQENCCVC